MDVTKATDRIVRRPSVKAKLDLFNDLSDIYPFGSPVLFHKTLDVLLLLSCTYLVRLCLASYSAQCIVCTAWTRFL